MYSMAEISILLFAVILTALIFHRRKTLSHLPYPPGPSGLPILGSILDIPGSREWVTYDKWCKELGSDIIYVRAGGSDLIILNSLKAIDDLLEKKSATYSSRPRLPMTIELMKSDWVFAMLPYGQAWKARRKMFSKYLHPSTARNYQGTQLHFVQLILLNLLNKPEDFLSIFQYAINGFALSLAYGLPIQKADDPYVYLAQETVKRMADSSLPGKYLVNLIPALKYVPEWFPGAGFQKKAKEFQVLAGRFLEEPFNAVLQAMSTGTARQSFTLSALHDLEHCNDNPTVMRKVIMDTAATTFAAAADTTLASVEGFIAAMLLSPSSQRKAQEELDRVLEGRLPAFNDEPSLPYIAAIVKEVLRWGVVAPVAVPHVAGEADTYRGYFIPKGSIVIPNSWALLRDEAIYGPDTSHFRPERFLKDGKLNLDIQDPSKFAFGYGRRACPGSHIALPFLFVIAATILSTFDISEELDENGIPLDPKIEWNYGVITMPASFKCTIKPRSRAAEKLIRTLESE